MKSCMFTTADMCELGFSTFPTAEQGYSPSSMSGKEEGGAN